MVLAVQVNSSLSQEIEEDEGKMFRYYNHNDDIYLSKYKILYRTAKGCWITADTVKGKRFILDHSLRSFAHTTRELALNSFIHRKRAQLRIIAEQERNAIGALGTVTDLKKAIIEFNKQVTRHKLAQVDNLLLQEQS